MDNYIEYRQKILQTVLDQPGVMGVLATRGQLLLRLDVEPVDMIQIKTGSPLTVSVRLSIAEDILAFNVLKDVEKALLKAVPHISGDRVKWAITVVSAYAGPKEPLLAVEGGK